MGWSNAQNFLKGVFGREDDAKVLSRRDALAGLGLAGVLLATPKLFASAAQAAPLAKPVEAAAAAATAQPKDATDAKATEEGASDLAADTPAGADVTELSAQRYWRRRYRRRYYVRRYFVRRRRWRRW